MKAGGESHPSWVRGLKQIIDRDLDNAQAVAPFMGAWIETETTFYRGIKELVAPFMGAWIETSNWRKSRIRLIVAPFMGAWIETPT